jgi:CRP-like cAMP-binding protein
MDTVKPLHDFLNKFVKLTDEEFELMFLPYIKVRKFGRKEILIRAGEVDNHINFILKGLIRKYYKKDKEEFNTQISYERHIIHCQESFHSRTPSEYFIEAIEPSVVVSFTYDDLEKIFGQSIKMEHLGRMVITQTMVLKDKWRMQLVKLTPRERFLDFVTRNPELMQRVPQKFLASYLNIKPETFSRFKHLIRNHSRTEGSRESLVISRES